MSNHEQRGIKFLIMIINLTEDLFLLIHGLKESLHGKLSTKESLVCARYGIKKTSDGHIKGMVLHRA